MAVINGPINLITGRPNLPVFGTTAVIVSGTTWDPANKGAAVTLSDANLSATRTTGSGYQSVRSTVARATGSATFTYNPEDAANLVPLIGICNSTFVITGGSPIGSDANAIGIFSNGDLAGGPGGNTGLDFNTGDIATLTLVRAANTLTIQKNGGAGAVIDISSISGATLYMATSVFSSAGKITADFTGF